jgi:hypothetical protein
LSRPPRPVGVGRGRARRGSRRRRSNCRGHPAPRRLAPRQAQVGAPRRDEAVRTSYGGAAFTHPGTNFEFVALFEGESDAARRRVGVVRFLDSAAAAWIQNGSWSAAAPVRREQRPRRSPPRLVSTPLVARNCARRRTTMPLLAAAASSGAPGLVRRTSTSFRVRDRYRRSPARRGRTHFVRRGGLRASRNELRIRRTNAPAATRAARRPRPSRGPRRREGTLRGARRRPRGPRARRPIPRALRRAPRRRAIAA